MGLALDLEQAENIKDCRQRRGWKLKSSAKSDTVDTQTRILQVQDGSQCLWNPFIVRADRRGYIRDISRAESTGAMQRWQRAAVGSPEGCDQRGLYEEESSLSLAVSIRESHSWWNHAPFCHEGHSGEEDEMDCTLGNDNIGYSLRFWLTICFLPQLLSDEGVAYKLRFSLNHEI